MGTILSNFREVVSGKYAQFTGRASRGEFWKYVLVVFIINLIFTLLQNLLGALSIAYYIIMGLNAIIMLGLLLPSLAVSVRRMHDIGKGGGWIFINLVPLIGSIWFLVLTIKEGEGDNRFGRRQHEPLVAKTSVRLE